MHQQLDKPSVKKNNGSYSWDQLKKYGQYKADIFIKLNFRFEPSKKMLDVGCGDGSDAEIFINEFQLDTYGVDVFTHEKIKNITGFKFREGSVLSLPFEDNSFDYVFAHDVLHHIDEKHQDKKKHLDALRELNRVVRTGGAIILVEGNRYNPLFYPHMVRALGHDHWRQGYFIETVSSVFKNVRFQNFEAHAYPWAVSFWKIYEKLMERFSPSKFLAYNVAIIQV